MITQEQSNFLFFIFSAVLDRDCFNLNKLQLKKIEKVEKKINNKK